MAVSRLFFLNFFWYTAYLHKDLICEIYLVTFEAMVFEIFSRRDGHMDGVEYKVIVPFLSRDNKILT